MDRLQIGAVYLGKPLFKLGHPLAGRLEGFKLPRGGAAVDHPGHHPL